MKTLQVALLATFLTVSTLSCISVESNGGHFGGQNEPVTLMTKTFDATAIENVAATTSGGNITIYGDGGDEATIEVRGRGNNGKNYTKEEMLEVLQRDYEFSVEQNGKTLRAITRRTVKGSWKNAVSVSYIIHVKKAVATDLRTSGGNITLSDLQGEHSFATSGGNIKFTGLSGKINGRTSGGNIAAADSHGQIKCRTSGGNIQMENLEGDVEMNTSGGNIKATHIDGSLAIATSGGNIRLSGINASLKGSTSGGSVSAAFRLFEHPAQLSTSGGSIRLEVPSVAKMNFEIKGSRVGVGTAQQLQVSINKQKDHATGTLNGGGPMLTAKTSGGEVKISFD